MLFCFTPASITSLKPGGLLVINEYVGPNRIQISRNQKKAMNEALQFIPEKFRKRHNLKAVKNQITGPGRLRMIITDPSEAVDSQKILPVLQKEFKVLEEKPYGGNLLMLLLKDIAHNFCSEDEETGKVLDHLFLLEDQYLEKNDSHFVFGVYKK